MAEQTNAMYEIDSILQNANKEYSSGHIDLLDDKAYMKYGNGKLHLSKIQMTEHGYRRSQERFNMDKSQSLSYFRSILSKAKLIGTVQDKNGKDSYLYGLGRIAVILDVESPTICTVYKQENISYNPLKVKVAQLHEKEFRKLQRTESARIKKLETFKLEANLEIAQCQYRIHKTRSQAVRNVCYARINAVNERLVELENEIKEIQITKKHVAKSMISVI
jgi:hypothetical protein